MTMKMYSGSASTWANTFNILPAVLRMRCRFRAKWITHEPMLKFKTSDFCIAFLLILLNCPNDGECEGIRICN